MKPWKVQKFFGDVVYDLRNRGLLPVVILLLVAMVVIPVLIAHGGSDSPAAPLQPTAASTEVAPESQQAVVAYNPGLRAYRKRLANATAKDPFRQQFAQPSAAGASALNSTVAPSASTAEATAGSGVTSGPSTSGSDGSSGSGGSSHSGKSANPVYVFYSVADLSIGDLSQPLQRHKKTPVFAPLPNQTLPVLIYLGATLNGKRAIFSVSKSATQMTGSGTCAPSPEDCSLLSLAAGQIEDMVYGADGKTYRLKVNKINRIVKKASSK